MIKITYICNTIAYVARHVRLDDAPGLDPSVVGQIAFFLDTATTVGDTLIINRTGDVFTFAGMVLLASPGQQQGPYFKLQQTNGEFIMFESRTMDGDYFLVSGIIVIKQGQVCSVVGNDITFQVDEGVTGTVLGSGDSPLPPTNRPLKTEKGVVKDTPAKGGVGIGGAILLFVLLLILGIVLMYLLLRGSNDEET